MLQGISSKMNVPRNTAHSTQATIRANRHELIFIDSGGGGGVG